MPYIKDVIDIAWRGASLNDIIIYTNADICVRTDCAIVVAFLMQDRDTLYSYRRDFYEDFHLPKPDADIPSGRDYAGCDLFAFRASWWGRARFDFPDLLLGRESWDAVMRTMMDWESRDTSGALDHLIYHRKHDSKWEHPNENRLKLKGQRYARALTSAWCAKHDIPNLVVP